MTKHALSVATVGLGRYRVNIAAATATSHDVTLPDNYLATLGLTGVPAERMIEESFRFLLEREPNTSILREFSLPLIERYFPEYRAVIQQRLRPISGTPAP